MNNLVKTIKEKTGLSIGQFCEEELNTRYNAFAYRVKKGKITPAEIFYIVYRTKTSVQELFGADLQELLVNSIEGDFADRVKNIIRTLSVAEQRDFANLAGLQAPTKIEGTLTERVKSIIQDLSKAEQQGFPNLAPTSPRTKKKTNRKRPGSSAKKGAALDKLFRNTY